VRFEMITALRKKLKASEDFLACTLKLKDALEKEDSKATATLLEERAELIAVIDATERQIARLAPSPGERNPEDMRVLKKISEDISDRLRRASVVNDECDALAAGRIERLKKELAALSSEERGLKGYVHRGEQNPRFLDIQT